MGLVVGDHRAIYWCDGHELWPESKEHVANEWGTDQERDQCCRSEQRGDVEERRVAFGRLWRGVVQADVGEGPVAAAFWLRLSSRSCSILPASVTPLFRSSILVLALFLTDMHFSRFILTT